MAGQETMKELAREKILFRLDPVQAQGIETESLWAERIGENRYTILNSPFFVYGVSFNDIVGVSPEYGKLLFEGVELQGGHSTYRLFLKGGTTIQSASFAAYWSRIAELGATYENANDTLIAVDVPPGKDITAIYSLFEDGENANLWIFEEANYEQVPLA